MTSQLTWSRPRSLEERRLRRVGVAWGLLFLNVLGSASLPMAIPIPHKILQVMTQGALVVAFVLALSANPRAKVRPNVFLGLYSLLAITTLMMSVRFIGLGTTYRATRLVAFLVVLWLLTPWWGRRDLVLFRSQLRFLVLVLISVVAGLVLSPHKAYSSQNRLAGALWPIPPTQVAHYTAELAGMVLVLWMCGMVTRRVALLITVPAVGALILTHTRTALVAAVVGLLAAGVSLFVHNRRVRRIFVGVILVVAFFGLPLSPLITSWLARGENSSELTNLTGRTTAWAAVLSEPRPEPNKILGSGLSNAGVNGALNPAFDGLPIDSSWITTYQDQGIVGDVLEGAMFFVLLFVAFTRPRGPARALALFLIAYCFMASFTESGMGEASPYLLDLTLAASLLAVPWGRSVPDMGRSGRHQLVSATP